VNHAQFADDTILLGAGCIKTARNFRKELEIYKVCSGSEINYLKSKIYGWNCSTREMQLLGRALDMEGITVWDTFSYLGIPIFKGRAMVAHWLPLLDRLKLKIQAWGVNWLTRAGKLSL
jgi:hypothetical protein